MQPRGKGFLSWVLSALWQIGGFLWGEKVSAIIRPLIPVELMSFSHVMGLAIQYGPSLVLFLAGAYFFWISRPAPLGGDNGRPTVSVRGGEGTTLVNTGTMHVLGTLTVAGTPPTPAPSQPATSATTEISLREAATRAYERLRQAGGFAGTAPDKLSVGTPLEWCGDMLIVGGLKIKGAHPPSRIQETIPSDILKNLHFDSDITGLRSVFSMAKAEYVDLVADATEVDRVIQTFIDKTSGIP